MKDDARYKVLECLIFQKFSLSNSFSFNTSLILTCLLIQQLCPPLNDHFTNINAIILMTVKGEKDEISANRHMTNRGGFSNFAQESFDPRTDSGILDSSPEEHGSYTFTARKKYLLLHRANNRFIICSYSRNNEILNALLSCNTRSPSVLVWQAFAYF